MVEEFVPTAAPAAPPTRSMNGSMAERLRRMFRTLGDVRQFVETLAASYQACGERGLIFVSIEPEPQQPLFIAAGAWANNPLVTVRQLERALQSYEPADHYILLITTVIEAEIRYTWWVQPFRNWKNGRPSE